MEHSFHSEDFSYEVMVQDVYAYMEYHGLESAIVLGHSMGGKVAMELAVTYSEKVKNSLSLILLQSTIRFIIKPF